MNNRGFFLDECDQAMVWHPFALPYASNILIKKAKGVYLYDASNKKYLDAVSSWWVNLHGHGNIRLKNALAKQFRKTDHIIFSGFTHEPAIRLAKKLLEKINLTNLQTTKHYQSVFYSDNGSTAVEVALKLGIQYLTQKGFKKIKIISFENAYHGDTFGAMAGSGNSIFNSAFEKYLFQSTQIPLPSKDNITALEHMISEFQKENDALLFIYEPLIQGSGGMNIYCKESMAKLLSIIKQNENICIADEVMTGFYRTGTFIASEQIISLNNTTAPDLICLSKGITGGIMPLGATVISKKIIDAFANKPPTERFYHGHSYTGNPLACAVALESLKLLNSNCLKNIKNIHAQHLIFKEKLKLFKQIKNIEVCGTIIRFEFDSNEKSSYTNSIRDKIYAFFIENGVLLRPLGNVVYIMPPYTISTKELNKIYAVIEKFCKSE
jgi:adenosylmethionine-8-amino-7-oxononanoate aminotransferase